MWIALALVVGFLSGWLINTNVNLPANKEGVSTDAAAINGNTVAIGNPPPVIGQGGTADFNLPGSWSLPVSAYSISAGPGRGTTVLIEAWGAGGGGAGGGRGDFHNGNPGSAGDGGKGGGSGGYFLATYAIPNDVSITDLHGTVGQGGAGTAESSPPVRYTAGGKTTMFVGSSTSPVINGIAGGDNNSSSVSVDFPGAFQINPNNFMTILNLGGNSGMTAISAGAGCYGTDGGRGGVGINGLGGGGAGGHGGYENDGIFCTAAKTDWGRTVGLPGQNGRIRITWPAVFAPKSTSPMVKLYRLYQSKTGEHFITSNPAELANLGSGAVNEGVAFNVYASKVPGTQGLYRCYTGKMHFISTNSSCEGFNTEGTYGYIYSGPLYAGINPLYRFYSLGTGDHLTTSNYSEGPSHGYYLESILGYTP